MYRADDRFGAPERDLRTLLLNSGVSALALGAMMAAGPALAQQTPSPAQTTPPAAIDDGTQAQVTADPNDTEDDAPTQDNASAAEQAGEGEANEVEAVVVTGIRGSLQSSQAIKRNAEVFVDSISAEDIGALPDRSVTEALQRVPGVSITRIAAAVDPDHFSVEGSGVVVRGLTFVRSEFNGRDAFTANNGRGLGFADVPAELLGGVDVFKNPSADMIEGGIAGTVNLRTRVPFDSKGRVIAGSLELSYADLIKEATPTYSMLVSDRWNTEAGEFGLLFNYVDSQLKSRSDGQQISNFGARTDLVPGQTVYFPRGAAFRSSDFDRGRTGIGAAGQWRSNDRTMIATLQFLRSEATQKTTEHAVEIATDNVTSAGDSRPVLGTTFDFDDNGVFTNGVITGPTGWRADQPCCGGADARTPYFGLQSNNVRRDQDGKNVTSDYGFNFKWTPTDRLAFNFDYQHVRSTVDQLDANLWNSSYQNASIQLRGEDPPIVNFLPPTEGPGGAPQGCAGPAFAPGGAGFDDYCSRYFQPEHASFSDPFNSFVRNAMDHIEQSEGELNAVRLDGEYDFDEGGWLDSVRVGYRRAERDQTTRFSAYNWGVISEQWGGNGPVWLNDPVDGVPNANGLPGTTGTPPVSQFELFAFDNFFRGQIPVPTGSQPRFFYAKNGTEDYAAYSALALLIGDEWRDRLGADGCPQNWVPLAQRCDVVAGTPFRRGEINPSNELSDAVYAMLRYGGELQNGVEISGNVGLRYVTTTRTSQGVQQFPRSTFNEDTCIPPDVEEGEEVPELPAFCRLVTPEVRAQYAAFANGAIVENSAELTYDYLLPSFNLKTEFQGGKILRFGYSKAITPPDLGLVRNFYNISVGTNAEDIVDGRPTGRFNVGNPYLKPISSDNFDASFEWYFGNPGSFTVSLFYKRLYDVLTNGTERQSFTNNGATFDAVVSTPVNSDEVGLVRGFEVAYQTLLDDFLPASFAGFGLNANYTFIDSEGVSQSTLNPTDPDVGSGLVSNVDTSQLPLQGLSTHTANLAGFYERGPVALRLAYSWRSEFLTTVRDVIVPFAPIMSEATGQLDGSAFYAITDNIKIGVQGVNLLNEITRTSQIVNNELLQVGRSWFMNDRRVTAVLRATF